MLLAKKFAYALACAAVLFAACSDDDKPVLPEEEVSEKTVEAIVVNEGQFGKNLGAVENQWGLVFQYPEEFRPLPYGKESIGSACAYRAAFRNTGSF